MYLDARAIAFDDGDQDEIDVEAYRDQIDELAERAGDGLIEAYRDSIAPTIMAQGDDDLATALEALVAYLFNAYRVDPEGRGSFRGDIHMALIGDPGKGKSSILERVSTLSPKCEFRSGPGMTQAGMTAAATQEEFFGTAEWTLEPGALPRSNGGHCIIDEVDKVDGETDAIHDALEGEQMVKVDKADIRANLPTRTGLCFAGNPVEGRFEKYGAPIADQVDMDPALVSRMDGLFALRDVPDPDHDEDVAWHILHSVEELTAFDLAERLDDREPPDEAETVDPPIPVDLFRAAIAYAQQEIFPTLTPDAKRLLAEFYIEVRQANNQMDDGDEDDPVPATPRKLEAGIRLATAFARAEYCEEVLERHAERAIAISKQVVGLNYDPETGKFDAGRTDEAAPKSQGDRRRKLVTYIEENQPTDTTGGIPIEDLTEDLAEEWGTDSANLQNDIDRLKQQKSGLYEPRQGEVRKA